MAVTLLGALWLSAALETRLMATQIDMSVRLVLSRLLRAGLFVLALLIALTAVGIDLTVLSVFGGVIGVGLGLGLQKIAANYVGGFAMPLNAVSRWRRCEDRRLRGPDHQHPRPLLGGARGQRARVSGAERNVHGQSRGKTSLESKRVAFKHQVAD